jgi:hypothetical protein
MILKNKNHTGSPLHFREGKIGKNKAKIKAECPLCNKLFEAKIGIKAHMRKCPNKSNQSFTY